MRGIRFCFWVLTVLPAGCFSASHPPTRAVPALGPVPDLPGLHNVHRLSDSLYSGSSPEGREGFESLRSLGVRTVLTVDGARPDVEGARRARLRYVHVPIGYDGVPRERALQLARAVRDLPGPVYLHCHHGKHRGPAAAAAVLLCLDPACPVETALEAMRRAGTDPHYTGLYASIRTLTRPHEGELDRLPADFPEKAEVPALVQQMVAVEEHWNHLEEVRRAGWRPPVNHPDLDPPHEALQLAEQYRESARLPEARKRGEEFVRWLLEAGQGAAELERALRAGGKEGGNEVASEKAFREARQQCTRCHAKFRDASPAARREEK